MGTCGFCEDRCEDSAGTILGNDESIFKSRLQNKIGEFYFVSWYVVRFSREEVILSREDSGFNSWSTSESGFGSGDPGVDSRNRDWN